MKKNEIFQHELLNNSETETYQEALKEWEYIKPIFMQDKKGKCICTQANLKKVIQFVNVNNGTIIEVGSDCALKFKLIEDEYLIDDLKKYYSNIDTMLKHINYKTTNQIIINEMNKYSILRENDIHKYNSDYSYRIEVNLAYLKALNIEYKPNDFYYEFSKKIDDLLTIDNNSEWFNNFLTSVKFQLVKTFSLSEKQSILINDNYKRYFIK